jgi:16S rRNA (cytosine967-C5)-methyltransferase
VDDYLRGLVDAGSAATRVGAQAVWLHQARPVSQIPGFDAGTVSVQDAGAQLAAPWLEVRNDLRVLDACAAPGGKTAHLAELADLDLTAIETDAVRARRIAENLERIGRPCTVRVADAREPSAWWDGAPFDRILLDAPCTGSGVVRRHPDIPWLRRKADVGNLATLQRQLLEALWPLLGVGGRLLYVVCSVFPEEGREQIEHFVARHPEAVLTPLPGGTPLVQLLPTAPTAIGWTADQPWPTVHDGFFYARLEKSR